MARFLRNLGASSLLALALACALAALAGADTVGPITFESSQGYTVGNIHGQPIIPGSLPNGGWSKTGPYDVQVAPVSVFPDASAYGFGSQALRISNAVTSGSFGDQAFSPGLADEAGETGADNAGLSGGLRQPHFDASFLIGTTQAAVQPGLRMTVSPDRGDGARMSFLSFEDQADKLAANGTTWENYYRYDPEQAGNGNTVPTVDKLLFRQSGAPSPGTLGNGFLLDRVTLASSGRNERK